MALCNEHKKDEYHDDNDCIVCEKDRAIKCCQARKEQLLKRVKQLEDTFKHYHVNKGDKTYICRKCGLDLRDLIHIRIGE